MKRVAGVALVLALAGAGAAATASSSVPPSTAGYTSVQVSGATVSSISYTVTANVITAFTAKLSGSLLLKTMSASFNGGTPGLCTVGVYDLTSNTTPFTCTGFTQQANRSWRLVITVN